MRRAAYNIGSKVHIETLPKHAPRCCVRPTAAALPAINNTQTKTICDLPFLGVGSRPFPLQRCDLLLGKQRQQAGLFALQDELERTHGFVVAFALLAVDQTLYRKNLSLEVDLDAEIWGSNNRRGASDVKNKRQKQELEFKHTTPHATED